MVQQVLLAGMLCNEGGRVSWPIYEGKNLSHMAPVTQASGKSIETLTQPDTLAASTETGTQVT